MVITFHGESFVKVSFGDTTLAFNPISKKSKHKQTRFGADVALISHNHVDSNGMENVTHGDKTPFDISGPGEYEVGGVTVIGFPGETEYGGEAMINTIYVAKLEGMNLCFLGHQNTDKLIQEASEALDHVDILFIPVGGEGTLDPARAHAFSVSLEPSVIIPISYTDTSLKAFLKEEGSSVKPVDKLTLKKKDLETKSGEIVLLKA